MRAHEASALVGEPMDCAICTMKDEEKNKLGFDVNIGCRGGAQSRLLPVHLDIAESAFHPTYKHS